jgi:hypothetical protein
MEIRINDFRFMRHGPQPIGLPLGNYVKATFNSKFLTKKTKI